MNVDPNLAYWTGAWLNMALIVVLVFAGIREIRRQQVARHRRRMLGAAALVGVFLVSYGLKLVWLGREALGTWAPGYVWVLRFHEGCIAVLLLAGATAVLQAYRVPLPVAADLAVAARERALRGARLHRRAGRTAATAATLGIVSAGIVLCGMYLRAG